MTKLPKTEMQDGSEVRGFYPFNWTSFSGVRLFVGVGGNVRDRDVVHCLDYWADRRGYIFAVALNGTEDVVREIVRTKQ